MSHTANKHDASTGGGGGAPTPRPALTAFTVDSAAPIDAVVMVTAYGAGWSRCFPRGEKEVRDEVTGPMHMCVLLCHVQ